MNHRARQTGDKKIRKNRLWGNTLLWMLPLALVIVIVVMAFRLLNSFLAPLKPREIARLDIGDEHFRLTFSGAAPLGGDHDAVHVEQEGLLYWHEILYVVEPDSVAISAVAPDSLRIDIYAHFQLFDTSVVVGDTAWWSRSIYDYEQVGEPFYLHIKSFTLALDELGELPDRIDVRPPLVPVDSVFSMDGRENLRGVWLGGYDW